MSKELNASITTKNQNKAKQKKFNYSSEKEVEFKLELQIGRVRDYLKRYIDLGM